MLKKLIPLILVLFLNLWIYRLFSLSVSAGIIAILLSIFLWLNLQSSSKKYFYLSVAFTIILALFQYSTSEIKSLSYLDEGGLLKQQERMKGYPPVFINIGDKKLWIPAANWLENRPEIIALYNFQDNLGNVVDPNLYFFANHPRERFAIVEFEKFPYIFMPVFLLGMLMVKKSQLKVFLLALIPLVMLTLIGDRNPAGPYSLFPFFAVTIALGNQFIISKKKYLLPAAIALILVFIQTIAYATY